MVRKATLWFGIFLTALGILGLVWESLTANPLLFGLLATDTAHDVMRIVIGLLAIGAATVWSASRMFMKAAAVFFAVLALLGLISNANGTGQVLGTIGWTGWDTILSLILAAVAGYYGYAEARDRSGAGRHAMSFGEYHRDHDRDRHDR